MKKSGFHSTLRIILFYTLFGGLWVAVSDRVLEALVSDPHILSELQTYKGWSFVIASALFLYLTVQRELRAREEAETELKASEEKYRTLIESANDAIFVFDAETGAIVDANKKAAELFGLPVKQIIGMHHADLHPKEDAERCRKVFEDALQGGRLISGDLCVSHRDGRIVPVEVSISVVSVGGRRLVQSIFRDITERKRAEEALEREKSRAQRYLDVAGVMLVVIGADQRVSLINKRGSEILGYDEEEIIGKNWFDTYLPARTRSEARSVFANLMRGEAEPAAYFENPVMTTNGEERMIAWHNTLLRDDAGSVVATLSSGEDITARKLAEEQAQSRLQRLSALHAIDLIITSSLDLRVTLREFLDLVISQMHVDAADVLLLNPHTQTLEYAAQRGFRSEGVQHTHLRLGEGIAGRAALEHQSIGIPNLLERSNGFLRAPLMEGEGFVAYYVVPLMAKGEVKGVLEILHRTRLVLNEEWQDFLEALAAQAAIAIDNAELFNNLQHSNIELVLAYDTTIEGWARALELRDKETEGHTQRAAEMTMRIASAMGMDEEDLVHVRRGALLHDIGKMSIPDSILLKTGPLTQEEWEIMRRHPQYAFELLSPIAYLRPALDIPYCHHERWDGTGYPRGLKGEQIPLAARIFSLADTWDALNSERRYHTAWSEDKVREHIRSFAGTQFDPKVVDVFLSMEQPTEKKDVLQ
jgi:PAS domain S-box-containing protein